MDPEELTPYLDLLANLFAPLLRAAEDPLEAEALLADLGYTPPSQLLAFSEFSAAASTLLNLVDAVQQAVEDDQDASTLLPQLLEALIEVGRLFQAINNFSAKIQANFSGSDFLTETDILTTIPRKLGDYLVVRYLENHHNVLHAALLIAGVVDVEDIDETPTPFNVPYRKRIVHWEKLPDFFNDPIGTLKANFTQADEVLYNRLLFLIDQLAVALGLLTTYALPDENALTGFNGGTDLTPLDEYEDLFILRLPLLNDLATGLVLEIYPIVNSASGKHIGLGMGIRFGSQLEVPISESYRLTLKLHASLNDSLGFTVDRDGNFTFINRIFTSSPETLAAEVQFGVRASVEPTADRPPGSLVVLGVPGGSRFEIGSASLAAGLEKLASFRMFVEGDLKDGKVFIGLGGADSFVSTLVSGGVEAGFNLGVGIANDAGLYFKGSSSLYIRLPLHLALGPINIEYLGIGFGFEKDQFPLTLTSGFNAVLGPLTAVVEDIGVRAVFTVKTDRSGNLGPLDVSFGFKPPNGVGLALYAGVVQGGGYLYFDFEKEEYAGALELVIGDFLRLTAIGLLTTRMPDGSKGFSLLIIITAEFGTGIQLGYGFVLKGVGGLLGLNRTMLLQPLMEGVRTGAINGILFPRDVIANAPRIISDLKTIFPPEEGTFLIGPMAKLGWGTPTLITISLGIIIEIPGNIAIIGVLQLALPAPDEIVLILQVNFAGAIEFDKKRLYFFAALFESRVLTFTLEGEMGLLAAFGEDANFVVTAGGFHPRFNPPPLPFPSPRRIALTILNEPNARILATAYFAVTTNTAQFGAHAELFFGYDSFSVEGHIGFDALFRFSPFYFIIEISATVDLKVFGAGVFSIRLRFSLEGPTPWRAHGRGSISLLFFEFSADFDETWGETRDTTLPPIEVLPRLRAEFDKPENWQALLPAGNNLLVSLRKLETDPENLVLHPVGTLRISQKFAPLDLTLDKVGSQKPGDARLFKLNATGGLGKKGDAEELFALAQFQNMDDAEKLSRPAFQRKHGGVDLAGQGQQLASGKMVKRVIRYEEIIIDSNYKRFVKRFSVFVGALFAHFLKGASVSKSTLSKHHRTQRQPFADKIRVQTDAYAVAFNSNNKAFGAESVFASEASAREFMQKQIASDPNLAETLHVIPQYELNE